MLSDELLAGAKAPHTLMAPGHKLGTPAPLIAEIPDEVIEGLRARYAGKQEPGAAASAAAPPAGGAPAAAAKGGKAAAAGGGKATAAGGGADAKGAKPKGGGGGKKEEAAPVDVSRLDIRVGLIRKVGGHGSQGVPGQGAARRHAKGAPKPCAPHAQTPWTWHRASRAAPRPRSRRGATPTRTRCMWRRSTWGRTRRARCALGRSRGRGARTHLDAPARAAGRRLLPPRIPSRPRSSTPTLPPASPPCFLPSPRRSCRALSSTCPRRRCRAAARSCCAT
jgi:hypothetical protein